MRRWFAILMLALLPMQFSWAAWAEYEGHPSDHQEHHQAHHDHHHDHPHAGQSVVDPDNASADQDAHAALELDCGHCHGGCASMPTTAHDMPPPERASQPHALTSGLARSLSQSPPERPQWRPLA